MKKYGDDADSFHSQGTRVEESTNWHRQNRVGGIYPHRSQPNRSYSKSSYYSTNTYKPRTTKKSDFKRNWSCIPSNYYVGDYYERNKHRFENKSNKNKTTNSKTDSDDWILGLCCVGIILIFIFFAIIL